MQVAGFVLGTVGIGALILGVIVAPFAIAAYFSPMGPVYVSIGYLMLILCFVLGLCVVAK